MVGNDECTRARGCASPKHNRSAKALFHYKDLLQPFENPRLDRGVGVAKDILDMV